MNQKNQTKGKVSVSSPHSSWTQIENQPGSEQAKGFKNNFKYKMDTWDFFYLLTNRNQRKPFFCT